MKRATPQGKAILLPKDVIEETVGKPVNKTKKLKIVNDFLKHMNALLNEGGGLMYLHVENPHLMGNFSEQVDDKLAKMIPDDSTFAEVFNRSQVDDNHIRYEVFHGSRPLSTLNFNTKLSLDKGLCDPTHGQIRKQCSNFHPSTEEVAVGEGGGGGVLDPLTKDDFVNLNGFGFQESVKAQAKRVRQELQSRERNRSVKKLVDFFWSSVSLPEYISAFTKLDRGGSVYFGVSEEKTEDGKTTGKFLCEGVQLNEVEQRKIRDNLQEKTISDMKWLAHSVPVSPIEISFHQVGTGDVRSDFYVMEVGVKSLRGLSFYDKSGPKAYELKRDEPKLINVGRWVTLNKGSVSEMSPVYE